MRIQSILVLTAMVSLGACGSHIEMSSQEYDMAADYEAPVMDTAAGEQDMEETGGATDDTPPSNPWVSTAEDVLSTFSVDVDSASYTLMRRDLNAGRLPSPSSVRTEEFINYFDYSDPAPTSDAPFSTTLEIAPSEFGDADDIQLLRIGVQAEEIPVDQRDPVNLVFLLDVSGSMNSPTKLGLVKFAMKHLIDKLQPTDTLGIAVYAGAQGVVLDPTPVTEKSAILDAIDALSAGGGTNGEAGIRLAYNMAESAFRDDGVNRVILCTDGDFNVGATGEQLVSIVEDYRDRDIFLTTLGFGMSGYNDTTMEQLADRGNGNYAFIDNANEAMRVLGEKIVSTLQVVAKDVKIQVEFDPAQVEAFRLIGYENRMLQHNDFANDAVDAGDIGAGHSVTALYEVNMVDGVESGPLAEVRMRYKEPDEDVSSELSWTIDASSAASSFGASSPNLRWSAAVAEYAEILRHSEHSTGERFDDIVSIANQSAPSGSLTPMQEEFVELVKIAKDL